MKTLPSIPRRFVALIAFVATATAVFADVPEVTPGEAASLVASGSAVLVDVREPAEWSESGVAAPAQLLPKSDLDGSRSNWETFLESVGDRQIITYCRSGRRSEAVAKILEKRGYKVANAGGFKAWKDAGLPTRSPESAPPSH